MQRCAGTDYGACDALAMCFFCTACEDHCIRGGSAACAAAWPAEKVEELLAELAAVNGLRRCSCGGLEDPKHPHRRCRMRAVSELI